MLYKKIHRQYLREFWAGREFKDNPGIIVTKLYIENGHIFIDRSDDYCMRLFSLRGSLKGIIRDKNLIEWLLK